MKGFTLSKKKKKDGCATYSCSVYMTYTLIILSSFYQLNLSTYIRKEKQKTYQNKNLGVTHLELEKRRRGIEEGEVLSQLIK